MFTLVSSSTEELGMTVEEMITAFTAARRRDEERLASAEAVIRAAPCAHEHLVPDPTVMRGEIAAECSYAGCEQYCPRCAWLRDA